MFVRRDFSFVDDVSLILLIFENEVVEIRSFRLKRGVLEEFNLF